MSLKSTRQAGRWETQAELLHFSLEVEILLFQKPHSLFLKLSADWMIPTHTMEGNLLCSNWFTDCKCQSHLILSSQHLGCCFTKQLGTLVQSSWHTRFTIALTKSTNIYCNDCPWCIDEGHYACHVLAILILVVLKCFFGIRKSLSLAKLQEYCRKWNNLYLKDFFFMWKAGRERPYISWREFSMNYTFLCCCIIFWYRHLKFLSDYITQSFSPHSLYIPHSPIYAIERSSVAILLYS